MFWRVLGRCCGGGLEPAWLEKLLTLFTLARANYHCLDPLDLVFYINRSTSSDTPDLQFLAPTFVVHAVC